MTSVADIDALLAAATAPPAERPAPKIIHGWRRTVREFVRDQQIEPGRVPSVEVCTLYRQFTVWVEEKGRKETVSPMTFARALRRMGFGRQRPRGLRKTDRDRKCVTVKSRACADRLLAWAKAYPDTPEDRRLFLPSTRWNR